jgi:hypothetical protein
MIGVYIRIAVAVAVAIVLGVAYHTVKDMGRQQERVERAEAVRKRLNDASLADSAATRCLADAQCRLSDDGFRRD